MNHPLFSNTPVKPLWQDKYLEIIDTYQKAFSLDNANKKCATGWTHSTGEIYAEVERQFPKGANPELWNAVEEGVDNSIPVRALVARLHA